MVDFTVFCLLDGSLTTFDTAGVIVVIMAGIMIFLEAAKKNQTISEKSIF